MILPPDICCSLPLRAGVRIILIEMQRKAHIRNPLR